MSLNDSLKNAALLSGGLPAAAQNRPRQYRSRQKQYYERNTTAFFEQNAQYASDFFKAEVQGLDPHDFRAWSTQYIRLADIVNPSAGSSKQFDDIKSVLFASAEIDYVPRGAKIVTAGSTWLVTNPQNISSPTAEVIAERCNAVWNHLDFYGNVVSEPIVVEQSPARAAGNNKQEFFLLTEGYYTVKAQYNEHTRQLAQNSRMILGSGAYSVHGFTDFLQEFTGNNDSVHMCEFYLYYEEPNAAIDDMENKVAGGLTFSWAIQLSGEAAMNAGETAQFEALSLRNGEPVENSPETPVNYMWQSDNTAVASVDSGGRVSAVSEGTCRITCTLMQNTAYTAEWALTVTGAAGGSTVGFTETPPESIGAYSSATLTAAHYLDGNATGDTVEWSFEQADEVAYSTEINGNSATVYCWGASEKPLIITVSYGGASASAEIALYGI
mgnify:FL=1